MPTRTKPRSRDSLLSNPNDLTNNRLNDIEKLQLGFGVKFKTLIASHFHYCMVLLKC